MSSIRKTKKRLKSDMSRLRYERTWFNRNYTFCGEGVWDMIDHLIAKFQQELHHLNERRYDHSNNSPLYANGGAEKKNKKDVC